MKNLSRIPRLSLLETFTILITLVVCLAGFTEAEVQTNYKKQDSNQQEENYHLKEASIKRNVPYAHETSHMTENESEDRNVANFQNIPEISLKKLIKRHSDEFGESDESDEKESDGYGYDDDEYYHFNFKRNDETLESSKLEKEGVHDSNEKGVSGEKSALMNQNAKENTKEIETIEMLNFKETHPSLDTNGNPAPMGNPKPYSEEHNLKKLPSGANILGSLKMSDLRGTASIDEKMKDRKDESGLSSGSSEMKASDTKKSVKVVEDKDSVKLKDSKLTDDTDQKEKETNLKDGKEAIVGKTLKENSKSSEEKEKNVKLSDSAKLEDNVDKMGGKTKESESSKLTREDTADITSFADKISSETINSNEMNQINNRASFVSSDYKDNADKTAGVEEDEKTLEENIGMDSSLGLGEYQEELRNQENFRKLYSERDVNSNQNTDSLNSRDTVSPTLRDSSKSNEYANLALQLQNINPNELFKKDWKNAGLEAMRFLTQSQAQQQQQSQLQQQEQQQQQLQQNMQNPQRFFQRQQQLSLDPQMQRQNDMNSDSFKKNFEFSLQPSELQNTEYHKNYIKYLKRYKGLTFDNKGALPDSSGGNYAALNDEAHNMKILQSAVKRRSMETSSEEKDTAQSKPPKLRRNARRDLLSAQSLRSSEISQALSKAANNNPKLTEGKKQEEQQEATRARRKSPFKLEYEIKVINQNSPDAKNSELSHLTQRRFEKDLKTKPATDEKYLKKYPYSQVSREYLTRLGEAEGEKKFKRKAPTWKRCDQKSGPQTRAVPSGYYGNRVKFGQKSYAINNERASSDSAAVDTGHATSAYFTTDSSQASGDKSKLQRSWEVRQHNYKHDPMKRYDESEHTNSGNTLFLVRKGQRVATAFEESSPHHSSETSLSPDSLAKLLSKENDYIVLKKTDSNKFQKISEGNANTVQMNTGAVNYPNKFSPEGDSLKGGARQTLKNKGLYVRSFRNDKDDKKFSSASHSSKSNLKKTFDKFRDLAGFFKDNEQESTDNQYSGQELKEGRDIVFSEDKLPDPIVISSDGTGKSMAFGQKQPNSIYSISTNFKTLDQQDKKGEAPTSNEADKNMFTAEAKADGSEASWEPTLRNIFPEAKSINTVSKNGNEIIVLDLNRNQLKTEHNFMMPSKSKGQQQFGAFGITSQVPGSNGVSSDDSVQFTMSPFQNKYQTASKMPQKNPYSNKARNNGAYAVVKTADNMNQVSVHNLADLPSLLRALSEKSAELKMLTKRSSPSNSDSQISENYKKFLTELSELSELNKSGYGKGKLAKKRTAEEIILPSSSFPELSTYGDENVKYLGNLLQNIMAGENFPEFKGFSGAQVESSNTGIPKSQEQSFKAGQMYLNAAVSDVGRNSKYQRRWSPVDEKNKDTMSLRKDKAKDESLRSKSGVSEDKNIQDELLKELAAASDKISRSRREGARTRNLRSTVEGSLSLRGKHESGTPSTSSESKSEDKCCKLEPSSLTGKEKAAFGSELKSDHDTQENSDKSFLKSNYENHLSEFFENLNSNKNQKDQLNVQNENTWKRKKRKENHRRKRSASHDVKNKVSTTAVQNTILKNLAEDNYQSVYSPGIKRRLFSTNNEADDADNYSDVYERDKNVIIEEAEPKCVKNKLNKCIDPMIVELFGTDNKEEEKNRARRSLTSGFHSNFKREIDLDESMPNDFQNFLVTSLGGFGSQNREIIKKDVALWERKESTQDAKQIAESSSPGGKEDPNSTLEKREVSSSENRNAQTYFPSAANSNLGNAMGSLNHVEKKLRYDSKSKLKSQSEFEDDKPPTQIRIQISNASSKEKKSSKPIMEESESTSTEMENLPKEKEFFDKNKINALRLSTLPKLHSPAKTKFPFSDYEENENSEGSGSSPQSTYQPRRRRRKKKKYAVENPMKPIRDFIKFDQKTMETFLKKVLSEQPVAVDQTTQKSPVASHLAEVETVYNPTQGADKAQLEVSRFGKINSANNKNVGTVRSNLQSTDNLLYDESMLRNYLNDKTDKIKSDKVMEYEDVDWKPWYGKMRLRQELGWDSSTNNLQMPAVKTDASSYSLSTDSSSYLNSLGQHLYGQKTQAPNSNYFFHPSSTNVENTNSLYDTLKLKQEMKKQDTLAQDHSTSKLFKKPFHYTNAGLFKSDDKERSQNSVYPNLNTGGGSWNYEYSLNKKPGAHGFKSKDFFTSGIKNQDHLDLKSKLTHGGSRKFLKNLNDEKSSVLDSPQSSPPLENKDTDYMDSLGVDEDYLEDDSGKDTQMEEPLMSAPMKYHKMLNWDTDDNMSEEEEEPDEDYDENSEEEDTDDYSLLANTRATDPELTKSNYRRAKIQNSFNDDNALTELNYVYPKDNLLQFRGNGFQQLTNPKNDLKLSPGRQAMGLSDMKNDLGSLSSSTNLLKKANENSNIFNKNLMKNTYGFNSENGLPDQLPEFTMKGLNAFYHPNKLFKRKMDSIGKFKRSREPSQIGSRLFYAAKSQINDDDPVLFNQIQRKARNEGNTYCRRNTFNAEFADPGNSFDEPENSGYDKLLKFGKNLQEEEDYRDIDQDEDQDFEDVAENLEDDGETISEDNILENVIGKYIMRKRVASSEDLSKVENSETEKKHKLEKRSLGQQKGHDVKIVKRLSSGHLTENNFRKYHKKNFSRKRDVNKYDFDNRGNAADGKTTLKKTRKREKTSQKKRSALDLFKKITNKDRDSKKVENVDGRTAGFEPLTSLNDKKYESSIRDNKFDFLNQVKKISNEGPQTQIKSTVVELKQHSPHEGQYAGDHRKMDKLRIMIQDNPSTMGQGPWKIELNEKYDVKLSEFPKNVDNIKEAVPASQDNENLKAFFVFRNNPSTFKRSPAEGLSPASGSSQKEVGNSYRPKSDEGRRISKMHVSKRSLDSSLVTNIHKEVPHTSTDHFTSGQNTETNVNVKEKNRALHDTISEGDSKPQSPHVLQRNTKESKSFEINDEHCLNAQFPPFGKTNNRMSVFPPSNETNIMRDSRQLNEETSKYLGQQIVDAILSHVSENPKFKELLAPGLAARTTAYSEDADTIAKPLQADVSDQLQFFLQKFMFDIEKLAEKHLRKRMCTQIDDQSKEFLQSLLNVSESNKNNVNNNRGVTDNYLKLDNTEGKSTTATTTEVLEAESQPQDTLVRNSLGELENLRKKHCLLLKLIDDFDKLTKLEKDSLRVHYQYLLEELEENNKQLGALSPVADSEFCSTNGLELPNEKSKTASEFEDALVPDFSLSRNCTARHDATPSSQSWQCGSQPPTPPVPPTSPSNPNNQSGANAGAQKPKPDFLPTFSFEEEVRPTQQTPQLEKVTHRSEFESVESINMTDSKQENNTKSQKRNYKESNSIAYSSPAPQMFDLLPFTNSTQKIDNMPLNQIPFHQPLLGLDSLKKLDNPVDLTDFRHRTELQKLSVGDAAGLQLSLKHRGPWVSNLDVAKNIRDVPLPLAESSGLEQLPKTELKESFSAAKADETAIESPSVADVKDSQSSFASASDSDYSSYANPTLRKNTSTFTVFPDSNLEMVVSKRRPFESVSKGALRNNILQVNYSLRKVSGNGKKRVFLRSVDPPPPFRIPRRVPKDDSQLVKKVFPRTQKVFTQSEDVLPQSSYVVFQSPKVSTQPPIVQSGETLIHTPHIMQQSPDVQKQSPNIVFQPSDVMVKSQNVETNSLGNSLQLSDTVSQASDVPAQPPDMRFQTSHIMMEDPNAKTKSSPEISFKPSDTSMQSTNVQASPTDMTFHPSDIMMQAPNVKTKLSPEITFQASDNGMKSTNDQGQSSDMTFQPFDFMMEAPNVKTKTCPEIFFQSSDNPMQSSNIQAPLPDMTLQPSDIMMEAPNVKTKSSAEISFEPSENTMQSTSDQAQPCDMTFQPSDFMMEAPNVKSKTPEMSYQPSETVMKSASDQAQPSDMTFQPFDFMMEAPNVKTKSSPEMSFEPSENTMQSTSDQVQPSDLTLQPSYFMMEAPNVKTKSSPEMSFEPSENTMQSTSDQAQPSDMTFQPSYFMMEAPNVKTKSSPEMSFEPSENTMQSTSDQAQPSDMTFQPSYFMMGVPDTKTKSSPQISFKPSDTTMQSNNAQAPLPDMRFQPSDIMMKTADAKTKSSPEISFEPPEPAMKSTNVLPQAPEIRFQPLDVMMKSSDTKTKSLPEMSFQPPEGVMQSTNVQTQLPYMVLQPSDMMMQTPDVKTSPSPDFSFQPAKNMIPFPNFMLPPTNNMMQPSNGMQQPTKSTSQFPEFSTQNIPAHVGASKRPSHPKPEPSYIPNQPLSVPKESQKTHVHSPKSHVHSSKAHVQSAKEHTQSNNLPHALDLPPQPPGTSGANTGPQPLYHLLEVPTVRKPCTEINKKHHSHPKKNRFFSHFPLPSEKRNKHKNRLKVKKSLNTKNSYKTDYKNDEIEYLAWSTMPAVRRQLNNLEVGLELDDFFWKNPKLKKMSKESEDSPV